MMQAGGTSEYLFPTDTRKRHLSAAGLAGQHGVGPEGQIQSLHQLQLHILGLHPSSPELRASRGKALRRCLLHFDLARLPLSSPICPTLAAVQDALVTGSLSFTVHATGGFDFTAEFRHVYDGGQGFAPKAAYGDFVAVCKRALVASDSGLADDRAEAFAKHILRMAAWEHTIAHETAQMTLVSDLPHLKAFVSTKGQTSVYSNVNIVIGRDCVVPISSCGSTLRGIAANGVADSDRLSPLCFWVRICPRLEPNAFPRGTNPETIKMESRAGRCLKFVYHRRFVLSVKSVDDFAREHDKSFSNDVSTLPPPPTHPPTRQHFSLALSCTQQPPLGAEDEAIWVNVDDDEEDEEAEEEVEVTGEDGWVGVDDCRSIMSGDTGSHLTHITAFTVASSTACFVLKTPSQCSELIGWGQNLYNSLGIDDVRSKGGFSGLDNSSNGESADSYRGMFYHPRPIPIPPSLAMERIKMLACSPRHTLLLTVLGNIYCCGENSEGALGLGDLRPRHCVTLLTWPIVSHYASPPKIVKVS